MQAIALTDIGRKRKINQDNVWMAQEGIGVFPNLFMLADGMGGEKSGDYASMAALELVKQSLLEAREASVLSLRRAVEAANEILFQKSLSEKAYFGMGTTLVLASYMDGLLYVVNVGDSRLYAIGQEIRQITHDHSYSEELAMRGQIKRGSKEYLEKRNILTRAVGAQPQVEMDIFEFLPQKDEQILLCSDGLYNMVPDFRIAKIVQEGPDVFASARRLVDEANRMGGADNISLILVSDIWKGKVKV